ncbi:MAG: hypothetical protein CMJ83_16805 [Planctomycetes bacterium]|nr:hypothetical protein [Planctomycetota bacterium]
MKRTSPVIAAALITLASVGGAQDAPRVVSLTPANGNQEVDAAEVTEIVVVFDRAMSHNGYSFTGGGVTFPKIPTGKRPRWKNDKTCVLPVTLVPDHAYSLGLNSQSFQNFRSRQGVALVPVRWTFSTLPEKLLDPKRQRTRNRRALRELKRLLPSKYSYYDLRVKDWDALYAKHEAQVLAARTDRGWAAAVGRMLAPTQDLHLYLRHGSNVVGTGSRAVDSLCRPPLLKNYLRDFEQLGPQALAAKSSDGIGYVLIAAWTKSVDLDGVERALEGMRDQRAIIIDVRNNSGGSEMLARRIARHFVKGKRIYAKHRNRVRKGKSGFGPVFDREIQGVPNARRFNVPVVVLTSRYVMSSCEAFVLMMKQAKDCTLIGQRTFGSSGNPKPHELPNGVTILIPSWQVLRLDGTCFEGEGLAPDLEVAATSDDFKRKDPILEAALAHLRKKL